MEIVAGYDIIGPINACDVGRGPVRLPSSTQICNGRAMVVCGMQVNDSPGWIL